MERTLHMEGMSMMKLFKNDQGWMVQTDDPKVRELFGTDTIPTAFTAKADPVRVLAAIQALNPGVQVEMIGDR